MPKTNDVQRLPSERRANRVTIQDVARAAGVAVSTVSRALNGSNYTSEATRRRVLAAAEALDFKANPSARGLRSSQTHTIGVLLSDLANPIFADFLRGAEHAAQARGYELLIADGQNSAEVQSRMLKTLHERRIDALIMQGPVLSTDYLGRFSAEGVPVHPPLGAGAAEPDPPRDESAANLAAFRHLVSLGHRRIHYFSRGLNPQMTRRFGALQAALRKAGCDPGSASLQIVQDPSDCRKVIEALSRAAEAPTAYVAGAHLLAPYMLAAIRDLCLSIPRDVSFLCFGDSPWALAYNPPISVVRFDNYRAGSSAVEAVLDALCGKEAPPSRLAADFVDRGSCGLAAH
jgi:LacI family transcriptional regulator